MSIYSEYACGYISRAEFEQSARVENRRERYLDDRQQALDAMSDACRECQYNDEEMGECGYGFKFTNCPELGTGEA